MGSETIQKIIPSKETRNKWVMLLSFIATVAWLLSLLGYIEAARAVTFSQWADFETALFFIYGGSEVGSKYSYAVLNKNAL